MSDCGHKKGKVHVGTTTKPTIWKWFIASMLCHISRMNLVWGCCTSINQPSPLSKYHCGFTQLFHHVQPLPNDRSKPWRDVGVCTTPLEHGTSTSWNYAGYIWYIELRIEKILPHSVEFLGVFIALVKQYSVSWIRWNWDMSMAIYRWSLNQGQKVTRLDPCG